MVDRFSLLRIILLLIALTSFSFSAKATEANKSVLLSGKNLDGKMVNLSKMRGKIVIVNFWASWCKECRKEMAILDEVYREFYDKNVRVIAISIDKNDNRKNVHELARLVTYPNLLLSDVKKISFAVPDFVPTSYLIDGDGNFRLTISIEDRPLIKSDFTNALNLLLPTSSNVH